MAYFYVAVYIKFDEAENTGLVFEHKDLSNV